MEYVEAYLTEKVNAKALRPLTAAAYAEDLALLYALSAEQGLRSVEEMGAGFFAGVTRRLAEEAYSQSRAARFVSAVHGYFAYLVARGILPVDTSEHLSVPRGLAGKREERLLTREELQAILSSPAPEERNGLRDRAVLQLLGDAGLTATETMDLRMKQVDLRLGLLQIDGRSLSFGKETRDALLAWVRACGDKTEEDRLFAGKGGSALSRQTVWHIVRKHAKRAGLSGEVNPRSLRRAFIWETMQRGGQTDVLREVLGVKTPGAYVRFQTPAKKKRAHRSFDKQTIGRPQDKGEKDS